MAKKPIVLDGLLNTQAKPADTGIPQRGAVQAPTEGRKVTKRTGERRLTLALDGETYQRLRLHAARTGQTHQAVLETALREHLIRLNA